MNAETTKENDEVGAIIAAFGAQLTNPARPLGLLVRFRVADGDQEKIESEFAVASVETAREEGVIAYALYREAADATRFVLYEHWRSLTDLEAHLRTPYIMRMRDHYNRVILGAPEFHVLVPAR